MDRPLPPISSRARQIDTFLAMELFERAQGLAREGRDVVHLTVGEPDFAAAPEVLAACHKALGLGETRYTHSLGRPELREEIAGFTSARYGVSVSPEQVIVTSGTSPALLLVFALLLEPGDEVLLSNPYYACYPNFLRFVGAVPRTLETREEEGFQLRAEDVRARIGPRTRAILVNSPANPTGCVMPPEEMAAICSLGLPVISDEIYHGLVYEGQEASALQFGGPAFVLNGFSKRFAMTGFRLGYLIVPRGGGYIEALQRLQQNLFISACDFVQAAGLAALRHGEPHAEEMKGVYEERRRFLLRRLEDMGVASKARPTGAFYALADLRAWTRDSLAFAESLLVEDGLGVTPGIDFGSNLEGFVRISYAYSWDCLQKGLDRLEAALKRRPRL